MRFAVIVTVLLLVACRGGREPGEFTVDNGGDPDRGREVIARYSCGACHRVPGVHRAYGRVAPPLDGFAERTFIAGELPNTAANLERWLVDPPSVEPGTAMPKLGLTQAEARDAAAYLLTLR